MLQQFIPLQGTPTTMWSDYGTTFVGSSNEISNLVQNQAVAHYCTTQGMHWNLTLEHAPHFRGIWAVAVKSFKQYLKVVVGGETKYLQ